jgi:recombination protein RecA
MQSVPHHLSDQQWQILLGGLMGDGALSPTRNGSSARFRWGHAAKQALYGDWKASLFANVTVSRSTNAKGAVFHDVQPLAELAELRQAVYLGGKKVLSDDYLKALTPLSLAIWYMDDGTFTLRAKGLQKRTRDGSGRSEICVAAFDASSQRRLRDWLADTWGIEPRLAHKGVRQTPFLIFPKDETAKFHALVAPFVHPSMDYKLLARHRGRFAVEPHFIPVRNELIPMPITKIAVKPPTRSMHRFDLEVAGTHNYFADGIMVHNSPETTPGGRALKFYSSVRLDIRRIESLKDGSEAVGNRTRVKVVKNKCSPPFRQAEFDIMYGKGISREGSLIDMAVDLGIVKKSGAWFTYEGEQLGQGRENAKGFLAENPEVMVEISDRVLEAAGLKPGVEAVEKAVAVDGFTAEDEAPIELD